MDPMLVLYAIIGLGAAWTLIWLSIITRTSQAEAAAIVQAGAARLRRRLILPLLAVLEVVLFVTLQRLPYPAARSRTLGPPQMAIDISALQWAWVVSQSRIPAHVPVEFALISKDANHDFAISDAHGQLLAQAQAMPGFTNRLIYEFDQAAVLTMRDDERHASCN